METPIVMKRSRKTLIRLIGASIGHNGTPVLAGIDLQIVRGSFVGLLGPNGCGKSTLLKTIVGILPILKGRMEFPEDGRPRFGYVPQRDTLDAVYPLTAFEVALMGTYGKLGPLSVVRRAMRERTRQALTDVRAEGLARRLFAELSGGERQRVLIARALAADPECLVLDEPVAGIDQATTEVIMDLAMTLHTRRGITILMVNHHILSLRGRADEIIWIAEGRMASGPADVMLSKEKVEEMLVLGGG
jgi:ABC-type Mn2+/Zn2+ transport system ATPase subunit